jgi:hypothetical protein
MPLNELQQAVGWAAVTFAAGWLLDMTGHYRIQLLWGAAVESAEPRFLTRLAFRHVVLLLLSCLGVYLYYTRGVNRLSAGVITWLVLLVLYGALLGYDSIRDLKERGRTE